ncbi:MAG: glycosyltransferase family 2 protein [Bacteroidales bacterium]|nr:glycosyltransferase family 2 protein [Bacteroidales bacterium]MCF8390271.1 glycosyltransferase family 2 protein [Bacteroidales bacterium]
MNIDPLVSINVITYNSSKFVHDTLESARIQTYNNIELIISDDASSDNTVEICREWVEKYGSRFVRTEILTVPKNTGIPANCNRSILLTKGDWIKLIAGDDALMPNCIQDNINHIINNPDIKVLYSYNKVYKNDFKDENFSRLNPGRLPTNIITDEITAYEQYMILLTGDKVPFSPTLFFNKIALLDTGLPDEDLFSEDYQTKLKFTRKGYKLYFMEKETVLYRQHDNATNNIIKEYILKPHYFKTENFRQRYIYPNIPADLRMSHKYSWAVNQIFKIGFLNKKSGLNIAIYYIFNVVLNPFKYITYIKSHFITKYKNDVFYQ